MSLWQSLHHSAHILRVHMNPRRNLLLIETFDHTAYCIEISTFFPRLYDIALLHKERWNIHTPAIHTNMAMLDQLTCLRTRISKSHQINDIIKTPFEQYQQFRTSDFLRT